MYEQIVTILANQLQINSADIEADTQIVDGLGADSLDIVEIVMTLESEFGISVPDEDIETLRTPMDIQQYIMDKTTGEQ